MICRVTLMLWIVVTPVALTPTVAAAAEHGASSAHSQHTRPPGFRQPKRVGQYCIKQVLVGEPQKAIDYAREALDKWPKSGEMQFALAVASAAQGQLDDAEKHMTRAMQFGLPPGRFLTGPDVLIEPLRETATYREIRKQIDQSGGLIHGPMVGEVTDSTVQIWVRTAGSKRVQAMAAVEPAAFHDVRNGDGTSAARSEVITTSADEDHGATLRVTGLEPGTEYHYRLIVGDTPLPNIREQTFRTMPRTGEPARFRFAFGGGAGYTPELERMWHTVESWDPSFVLLLGDNIYSDDPQSPELQRYTYYRRQSRPEWRNLVSDTPVMTIWDDHDFSNNDSWGGPHAMLPEWKPKVWEVFRQNWANPGYGGGADQPGCWYDFHAGDVHFIMLDCRYYRTSPDLPVGQRSMLGAVQKRWFKETISESDATFKVIASSVPWDFRTKGDSPDTWNGFRHERNELFSYLRDEQIEGVILISADRHRSDAWRIGVEADKPAGLYDLYEFNSSRLTNVHVHREKKEAIFSYNDKQSFGLVTVDTTATDPTMRYQVISIDGEPVEELTVHRSQLGW